MRNLILLLTALISTSLWAETVTLQKVKTFPVAKELTYDSGEPATVIETANIFDDEGKAARGPHTIKFTLDPASSYAVMVSGQRVEPGETFTFVQNLTTSGHKLVLPIYPADGGIEGVVNYSLDIPDVKSMICLPGQQELEDGCMTVTYEVLVINCSPEFVSDTSNGIQCVNYTTAPITLYCEDGYDKTGENCTRITVDAAPFDCYAYPGAALEGAMCVQQESHPVSKCESGWSDVSGQCRGAATTYNASLGCNVYQTWNGSKCEEFSSTNASHWKIETCGSKYTYFDGMCYDQYAGSCPAGYHMWGGDFEICYKDGETKPPYSYTDPICPGGMWTGSQCLKNPTPKDVSCRAPGSLNTSNGMCEWWTYTDMQYSCPSGGSLSGSTCSTYNYVPYGTYCLSGGEFNSATGNCETDINEPAGRHCDDPSVMEPDGESCKLTEEYLFKNCDDDTYSPASDYSKCERTLTEVPVLECDPGFEVDEAGIQCVKKVETPFIG